MSKHKKRNSLFQAYHETSYETNTDPKFKIKIGETNKALDSYLQKQGLESWVFITAENPFSKKSTPAENRNQNLALETCFKELGFSYLEGKGILNNSNWEPENSYLVLGMNRETGTKLSFQFQQNAFVFGMVGGVAELVVTNWLDPELLLFINRDSGNES